MSAGRWPPTGLSTSPFFTFDPSAPSRGAGRTTLLPGVAEPGRGDGLARGFVAGRGFVVRGRNGFGRTSVRGRTGLAVLGRGFEGLTTLFGRVG